MTSNKLLNTDVKFRQRIIMTLLSFLGLAEPSAFFITDHKVNQFPGISQNSMHAS